MSLQNQNTNLEKMRETILRYDMISDGDSVVVGLSGGPDSACLLCGLVQLREELGIRRICAVHINHGLRGEEADRDEAYSRCLSEALGTEFRSYRFDVSAEAERWRTGSEAAGRRIRYETFERVSREIGAERTAVAHNSDDQAETILMRILRGTGVAGLSGMEYVRDAGYGKIIRPILDMSRREIEDFCRDNGLSPVQDSTNDKPVYTRNKIRLELLPHLKSIYNPAVYRALIRLGKFAREDDDYLMSAAGKIIEKCWDEKEKSLQISELEGLHPAVLKRVILQAAKKADAGEDLDESRVNAVLDLLNKKENREADLVRGNYVRLSYGKLWFLRRFPENGDDPQSAFPFAELQAYGRAELDFCGSRITLCKMSAEELKLARKPEKEGGEEDSAAGGSEQWETERKIRLYFDWELLKQRRGLVFRFRHPGDRIRLRGMTGRKKLQDFFVDRKIPRHLRDEILLLADGEEILSAGREVSAECCEKPDSISIVSIEY